MFDLILYALFGIQSCDASVFATPGDKLAGGVAPYLGRKVRSSDHGVAMRYAPMGSKVWILNPRTGKSVETTVIDRGPFGRLDKRGRWYNGNKEYQKSLRNKTPILTGWRRCVDMTKRIQRLLGHNGMEPVLVITNGMDNGKRIKQRTTRAERGLASAGVRVGTLSSAAR